MTSWPAGQSSLPDHVAKIVQKIVFLWENFGPYHLDRLNAVADRWANKAHVIGLELSHKSSVYDWEQKAASQFERITLTTDGTHFFNRSKIWQTIRLITIVLRLGRADFFLCHYEQPAIFLTAVVLRLFRRRVFIMNDMKYADFKRRLPREFIKAIFHAPYCGAIAAGRRSADYFRFMGINEAAIHIGYGAVALNRLDNAIATQAISSFSERPFIIVARFMPMKNLFRVLDAYKIYRQMTSTPRELHLCGSGPLDAELREYAKKLGLSMHVRFRGYLQADDVTRAIAASLCLILFSTQETFGNVIIEALALGVPVIATPICGATDEFLKSGLNGYLVEPNNVEGLAALMKLMDGDETQWKTMSDACRAMRPVIDIDNFSKAVGKCITANSEKHNQERL